MNLLSLVGLRRAARADCWLSFSFWVFDVRDVRLNSGLVLGLDVTFTRQRATAKLSGIWIRCVIVNTSR